MQENRFSLILFLVAGLAAVGQTTNTIYVPAMSMIANDLQVNPGFVQSIMGVYLLTYGSSQFIHGPLSDWFGRRPIVMGGLSIFCMGSLLAAFASTFPLLLVGSFVQGLGIGVGGMMTRTVMRDLYTGRRLHTASSYMSATLIIAPLIAPCIGGVLAAHWGWRANFGFLAIFSLIILFLEYLYLPETNSFAKQPHSHPRRAIAGYKIILSHPQFQGYMICLLLTFAGVSVIEAVMGLLFGNVLSYGPEKVSILFILPLPGYLIGSFLSARLNKILTMNQLIILGILGLAIGAFSMLIAGLMGAVTLVGILVPAVLFFFGSGILFPTATAGALEPFRESAGKAGALLGGLQNLGSGFCALISSFLPQETQLPLACILVVLTFLIAGNFFNFIRLQDRVLQNV